MRAPVRAVCIRAQDGNLLLTYLVPCMPACRSVHAHFKANMQEGRSQHASAFAKGWQGGALPSDRLILCRGLFIISPTGILRQMTINDLPVGRSVDETLRLVKAFQVRGACRRRAGLLAAPYRV